MCYFHSSFCYRNYRTLNYTLCCWTHSLIRSHLRYWNFIYRLTLRSHWTSSLEYFWPWLALLRAAPRCWEDLPQPLPFPELNTLWVTWFSLINSFDVVTIAFEGSELIDIIFEVGNDARRSIFEQELDEVECLNSGLHTFRIFFQLLLFLSFSQMNSLMRCHF